LALYYGYKGYPTSISPLLAAKKAIDAIYKEQLDDINVLNEKLLEASHADSMAWAAAKLTNTIEGYNYYVSSYKYGNYYTNAIDQIDYIVQAEKDSVFYALLPKSSSLKPYVEFISGYDTKRFTMFIMIKLTRT
jgi:hypothetical protein